MKIGKTLIGELEVLAKQWKADSNRNIWDEIEEGSESFKEFECFLKDGNSSLKFVEEKLQICRWEAIMFSAVFIMNVRNNHRVEISSVANFYRVSNFTMLKQFNHVKSLQRKGYVSIESSRNSEFNFKVSKTVFSAIISEKEDKIISLENNELSFLQVVEELHAAMDNHGFKEPNVEENMELINESRIEANSIKEIAWLNNFDLTDPEFAIVMNVIYNTVKDQNGSTVLSKVLEMAYTSIKEIYSVRQKMINGTNVLMKKKILEFKRDSFIGGNCVGLTDFAQDYLLGQLTVSKSKMNFTPSYLTEFKSETILSKSLFFNENVKRDIDELSELLKPRKYKYFLDRMDAANMNKGLTILMYGYPGTGKTESVKQLARKSNRHLLMVDISTIRDKWVGESEKRLKKVFMEYKRAKRHYKKTPILLFNEADALIGKRMNVSDSVDQMNNSMQNILLQELEDFEGILIATTNLKSQFDKAFERRFLIKTKFEKPDEKIQYKILKSRIKTLTEKQLLYVSKNYYLTGGQIENLAKRLQMQYLLGKEISDESVNQICIQELMSDKHSKGHKRIQGFLPLN